MKGEMLREGDNGGHGCSMDHHGLGYGDSVQGRKGTYSTHSFLLGKINTQQSYVGCNKVLIVNSLCTSTC